MGDQLEAGTGAPLYSIARAVVSPGAGGVADTGPPVKAPTDSAHVSAYTGATKPTAENDGGRPNTW